MDTITASKPKSLTLSKLADLLKEADTFARKPFGYDNPPGAMLADLISLPALQKTVERKAYGEPLTSGKGWATRMLPETAESAIAAIPAVAKSPVTSLKMLANLAGDSGVSLAAINPKVYGLSHRPMTIEGGAAQLHDLSPVFGEDIYGKNALQYFGGGLPGEAKILKIMQQVKNNPDAEVTIYRGLGPGSESTDTINPGDWVTLIPDYAKEYGRVVSKKVKASDITSWPDSLAEFGYYPQKP